MDSLRPIFWGQGMFLLPQHFQQQDQYHDAQLRQYFHLFVPFCWGVKALEVNTEALETFRFEATECEIVTRDGTVLRFGGDKPGNTALTSRLFKDEPALASGKPLAVYLGVKKLQLREPNLRPDSLSTGNGARQSEGSSGTRFIREEASVTDVYEGKEEMSRRIDYLSYEGRLFFGDSVSPDYDLIQIAEVTPPKEGSRRLILSDSYIPPLVTIRASSVLRTLLARVRDRLQSKGQELEQTKRQQRRGVVGSGLEDYTTLLALQTINRYLPLFQHALELEDHLHPQPVYAWLRQLVGELSTFSRSISGLGAKDGLDELRPYNHDDLWSCFGLAVERIVELLGSLQPPDDRKGDIILRYDGENFAADLPPEIFVGDTQHYLAIKDNRPWDELLKSFDRQGLIASREEMPERKIRFIRGLTLKNPDPLPFELLEDSARYRYFLVDQSSPRWKTIQQRTNIAVFSAALPSDTDVRLITIYGKNKQ